MVPRAVSPRMVRVTSETTLFSVSKNYNGDSSAAARRFHERIRNPELDRGPSDFDIRHQLAGYLSYVLPAPVLRGLGNKLFRNWKVDSIFNVHSARPLTWDCAVSSASAKPSRSSFRRTRS